MALENIVVKGARENNLKNIDVTLPRQKLTVVTGLSGSGKSSLVFDTVYAEGRRRYMESLSSYARQFLGKIDKPDVDSVEGLSPAISIDQKGTSANPRSTVGTVTEIYDYLRLLYARIGQPHCPDCGRLITPQTVDQIVEGMLKKHSGEKFTVLAPVVRGRKGQFQQTFREILDKGFVRVRIDGQILRLDDQEDLPSLDRYVIHNIEIVVDRVQVKAEAEHRLAESVELALQLGDGTVILQPAEGRDELYSQNLACVHCGLSFQALEPRLFSFNSPFGACPQCSGLGYESKLDLNLVVPDQNLSLRQGALAPWGKPVRSFRYFASESWFWAKLERLAELNLIDLDIPWDKLDPQQRELLLYGNDDSQRLAEFSGAMNMLEKRWQDSDSEWVQEELSKYRVNSVCSQCGGSRLKPEARAVTVQEMGITELCNLSILKTADWINGLELSEREAQIAKMILREIKARLQFLLNVGLDYLSLSRTAATLSGGEAQRIRLATQIGSGLVGVLYILDEPSIGLHQRDNQRLLQTLQNLRDLGNTLVVVEHDEDTIRAADHIVDIGPGAGIHGGEIVAQGSLEDITSSSRSLTGDYLSGRRSIPIPETRRPGNGLRLTARGCRCNNLKDVDISVPLGRIVGVTGVSGSGKSTFVNEILYKNLAARLGLKVEDVGFCREIEGAEHIDKLIVIDQSPIGRTPRSNACTYTGMFDPIRTLFAAAPEAKIRAYKPGRFSFNVKGGRCETCQGQGIIKIEMNFLPDVFVPCEVCGGRRYNRETLEVRFKGKNIAEVLDMTAEEGLEFFANHRRIRTKLQTLCDVGLGYIKLGQAATTLSGGEAQRIKLAFELSKTAQGHTLYILDEPTTGLHFEDIAGLMRVLQRLTDAGNSMIIIEHNLDVIKCCDWLIDLGPEGGDRGGRVVTCGTPEEVAACPQSWTGRFLRKALGRRQAEP
ncbi:excinuclease ABC subunit UvrA [bacterium]|nr:excinuclease ABC subunit UvrA [bacterium]